MDQIQKTAIKETAKAVAGLTAIGIAVPTAIFLIPIEVLGVIISVVAIVFGIKMIYDVQLVRAKFNAEYNNTVDQ